MLVPERNTEDGFEFHFGLNYLGHFLLTNLLLDTLKRAGRGGCCSRIINMSSATHYAGVVQLDDLNRRYDIRLFKLTPQALSVFLYLKKTNMSE